MARGAALTSSVRAGEDCGMTDPGMGCGISAPADAGDGQPAHLRGALIRRSALLGGAALASGGLVTALARGGSQSPTARDERILNYVLRLEHLKAAFYREAVERGALSGELEQLATLLARHEEAHVAFFEKRLGGKAEKAKVYDFGEATRDPDTFAATANKLEEAAVAAYIGQGANLTRSLMAPFAGLCSVEARHAAWIADVLQSDPAPSAADKAKAPKEVARIIEDLGFEANG
jgi:hypothetical protein